VRWIIGDIHGMHRMLATLLDAVRGLDGQAKFYFVGDYVNRGPESKQVVDLLLTLPDAKFLRGNHDEIFDLVINGRSFESHPELNAPLHAFVTFLQYGLDSTLTSYGIDLAQIEHVAYRPSPDALAKLLEPVPVEHRAFFRSLPATAEEPDLLVAHAKWDVDQPNDSATIAKILPAAHARHLIVWGRYLENEVKRKKPWSRLACFGHTPVSTYASPRTIDPHAPIAGPNIVLLDSGAALSLQGRLTAFCADDRSVAQVNRGCLVTWSNLPG
jgi:serine/threonine protein phosphatase 1